MTDTMLKRVAMAIRREELSASLNSQYQLVADEAVRTLASTWQKAIPKARAALEATRSHVYLLGTPAGLAIEEWFAGTPCAEFMSQGGANGSDLCAERALIAAIDKALSEDQS